MILDRYDQSVMDDAAADPVVSVDTETVSLTDKTIVGFSFAYTKADRSCPGTCR